MTRLSGVLDLLWYARYAYRFERAFARHWYRSALACGAPPDTPMVTQAWAYGPYPRKRLRSC